MSKLVGDLQGRGWLWLLATNLKKMEYLMIRRNYLREGVMIRRVFTRIEMIINAIEGDLRLPGNPQILLLDIRCSPTMPSSGDVEKAAHI